MKKVVALLLSITLLIVCCPFTVTAKTAAISPQLQEVIENSNPDDIICLYITYNNVGKNIDDMPSWPDRDEAINEYKEYRIAKQKEIQSAIFDGIDVSVLTTVADSNVIAYVKAKDINTIADHDLVAYIDKFNNAPEISDKDDETSNQNDKIQPGLRTVLEKSQSDEIVCIYITYNIVGKSIDDMPSWPDRDEAINEYKEYRIAKQKEIQSAIFDGVDVSVLTTVADSAVIAYVKAKDINTIVANDLISYLDWFDDSATEYEQGEGYFCFEKFKARYNYRPEFYRCYDELYYHKNNIGNIDWVLLHVEPSEASPVEYCEVLGNRLLYHGSIYYPFASEYGVYNVQEDTFEGINSAVLNNYDGLAKAFDEFGEGRLFGDIDGDNDISIIDATIVQRCEVKIREYPASDEIESDLSDYTGIRYYSDFNRDGERDIIDATCIQRYLIGMSYPR